MIEFQVRYGKRAGIHYIFESTTEAIECLIKYKPELNVLNQDLSNPFTCFRNWMQLDLKEGEWIKSDDGKIIQVWKVYFLNMKQRTNRVVQVKVCCGIFYFYENMNGQFHSKRMTLSPEALSVKAKDKGSMGEQRILGKNKTLKKMLFAYYCLYFGNPVEALLYLQKTTRPNNKSQLNNKGHRVMYDAFELIKDPIVLEEIKRYERLNPMAETFKEKFKKALETEEVNPAFIAENIRAGLDANLNNPKRLGGIGHSTFIKLGIESLNFVENQDKDINLNDKSLPKSDSNRNIVEANYKELPAPPPPKNKKDKLLNEALPTEIKVNVESYNKEMRDKRIEYDADKIEQEILEEYKLKKEKGESNE